MNSYLISREKDTLIVDFNRDVAVEGDQLVIDAQESLQALIESGEIPGGELLKIKGPSSVLLGYTLAHNLVHLYKAIAVSDPRLGAYVVVSSTTPQYPVGARIDFVSGKMTEVFSPAQEPGLLISWDGEALKAQLNRNVQIDGDQIVREVEKQLNDLIETERLKGGKLLKINGRASVLGSYVIAHKLAHLYGAIAVYDPKIGEKGLDKYVVVISHNEYEVGQIFEVENLSTLNVKVVICGPANTGKTCIREGLKQALLKLESAPDSYVISGCPDGDGSWYSETAQKYPELAEELKKSYKAGFNPEYAQKKAQEVDVINTPILVFDVGGRMSEENEVIMSKATHAIVIAKTEEEAEEWQEFCQGLSLKVIAILYSDLRGSSDLIEQGYPPFFVGTIQGVHRGVNLSCRPIIQELAKVITSQFFEL